MLAVRMMSIPIAGVSRRNIALPWPKNQADHLIKKPPGIGPRVVFKVVSHPYRSAYFPQPPFYSFSPQTLDFFFPPRRPPTLPNLLQLVLIRHLEGLEYGLSRHRHSQTQVQDAKAGINALKYASTWGSRRNVAETDSFDGNDGEV